MTTRHTITFEFTANNAHVGMQVYGRMCDIIFDDARQLGSIEAHHEFNERRGAGSTR